MKRDSASDADSAFRRAIHVASSVSVVRHAPIWLAVVGALVVVDAFQASMQLGQLRAVAFWVALVGLNVAGWTVWRKILGEDAITGTRLVAAGVLLNGLLAIEVPILYRLMGRADASVEWRVFVYGLLVTFFVAYVRCLKRPVRAVPDRHSMSTVSAPKLAETDFVPTWRPAGGVLARGGVTDVADLMAIRAEDHYCRLLLRDGRSSLVHYRFKDALHDLAGHDGAQVHRSVWVAAHAVVRGRREGRRWSLELSDRTTVPVSQTSIALCRLRGWLTARDGLT